MANPAPVQQTPTLGRVVHYRLTKDDCAAIEAQRRVSGMPGNPVVPGAVVPAVVVAVWPDEYPGSVRDPDLEANYVPASPFGLNPNCILDGYGQLWVTSRPQHAAHNGAWFWPPRA